MKPFLLLKKMAPSLLFILVHGISFGQGKLVVNGATINVMNGGYVNTYDVSLNGSSLLNVNNSRLTIRDSIHSSSNINMRYGTLQMAGANEQAIPANAFWNNAVSNLMIGNTSATGVSLGGAVDIYNSVTYSGTGMKLSTNDSLTFKSTATYTAWLGDMTGNTITGKATVERYLEPHQSWRFLSVPTNSNQSVRESWQEGAVSSASNPKPGYGIQITGPQGTSAGFDLYSISSAMKTYNPLKNTWTGISSTTNGIKNNDGYMVFVRGDRTVTSRLTAANATVLRTFGNLYVGDQTPIIVSAGKFAAIGNPYASSLNMRSISKTGVKDFFYVWDPMLSGVYGYGGYQTFSNDGIGNYIITPGGGSYGANGSISNYILSGLAFFVQGGSGDGSVTLNEGAKSNGSSAASVAARSIIPKLSVSLYRVNADDSTEMADAALINYGDNYSNKVDDFDAYKLAGSSENLSLKTDNILLVIERRHTISGADTIFLNITGTRAQQYQLVFAAAKLYEPGLTGFLEDNYLHTSTPLNIDGATSVNFNITNIAGSSAANRFRIVFRQLVTLPVTFTSIKAYQQSSNINVEWKVENEINIQNYEVEKSSNGNDYIVVKMVASKSNVPGIYDWLDLNALPGNNYYRIVSTGLNNEKEYSAVVKVFMGEETRQISVYPNPVTGDAIHLLFGGQKPGLYEVRLLNIAGQVLLSKEINHREGVNTEKIPLGKLTAHGVYQLEITKPGGNKMNMNVVY